MSDEGSSVDHPEVVGRPDLKELLVTPEIAKPTVAVFVVAWLIAMYTVYSDTYLFLKIPINLVVGYVLFTIMHESIHNNVYYPRNNLKREENNWYKVISWTMGRLSSAYILIPFPVFKFVHIEHHKHTNNLNLDPDMYSCGPEGMKRFPFTWITQGFHYYYYYFTRRFLVAPISEKIESAISPVIYTYVLWRLGWHGLAWFVFSRLLEFVLILVLSYLPHHPHNVTLKENRFRATNTIYGWWWDIPMMYQNYHVIHHLYPYVPFYYYRNVWLLGCNYFFQQGTQVLTIADVVYEHIDPDYTLRETAHVTINKIQNALSDPLPRRKKEE